MAGQLTLLSESLGRVLDPEQTLALDVTTGLRADGRPASLEAAVICPRQNMKSWNMQLIALGRLLQPGGDKLIVWSAHEVATSQATFHDFIELIETHPWLARRVVTISRANGKEGIEFTGGRWLRFRARIRTGGRGLSGDAVFLDEAFALLAVHLGALLPILSTRRRAAVFYGSSAGLPESAVLRKIRDRGRAGGRGAPAYVEWCAPGSFGKPGCEQDLDCKHAPGTRGCVLDCEDLWIRANPAARVGRISLDYLRAEREALDPAEFARERLGWWDDAGTENPVDLSDWAGCVDAGSTIDGDPAVGFAIGPGLRTASVAACGFREDGLPHVELIQHEPGVEWLGDYLAGVIERRGLQKVYAPSTAFVAAVLPALRDAGVEVELLPPKAMAAGCETIAAETEAGRLRHLGDPLIMAALAGAAKRDSGDGSWVWSYKRSDVDISPIEAVTAARRGLAEMGEPMGPMAFSM